ncbi:MAG: DUF3888 domain-containing protein [Cellulosilyticaceae bacterium]
MECLKKKIISICMIAMFFCVIFIGAAPREIDAKEGIPYSYTPKEGSVEELYKDIIVTQIQPYISDEIQKQYGQKLPFDLFDVEFLKIDREHYRGFSFLIKLQVKPFVGAHNTIGVDNMLISISPEGTKVESFEHVESFALPEWLQEIYKNLNLKANPKS